MNLSSYNIDPHSGEHSLARQVEAQRIFGKGPDCFFASEYLRGGKDLMSAVYEADNKSSKDCGPSHTVYEVFEDGTIKEVDQTRLAEARVLVKIAIDRAREWRHLTGQL